MKSLRSIIRFIPTLLTALLLAMVVWVSAVTSTDPNEEITYINPVPVTILGQNPDLLLTSDTPSAVTIRIKAPRSIHAQLSSNANLIHASINLSGLSAGTYKLTPKVTVDIGPTQVTSFTPAVLEYTLEQMVSKSVDVTLRLTGNLPISFEVGEASIANKTVRVTGPESKVNLVTQVIAGVDLTNMTTSISRTVELSALDSRGTKVTGVDLTPSQVSVDVPIKQLGGYRNVFVKIVTTGSIARGFYLTGLVALPPNITIYASNPEIAKNMPSFVETAPINLNGAELSFETIADLNLPEGITVVGESNVIIQVGIAPIESSLLLVDVPLEVINLTGGLKVTLSPDKVDVYVSGPLYLLDQLTKANIKATLDLAQMTAGNYQLTPAITFENPDLRLDTILPGTIEVVISR